MTREIQFRAWDGKKMWYSTKEHIVWVGGQCASINGYDLQPQKLTVEYDKVMQYTGLHDKNGKEIYEGDILLLPDTETESIDVGIGVNMPVAQSEISCFGTVIFQKGCFGLQMERSEQYGPPGFYGFHFFFTEYGLNTTDIEIIGNIHENPEWITKV